jgi:hypothetical protein
MTTSSELRWFRAVRGARPARGARRAHYEEGDPRGGRAVADGFGDTAGPDSGVISMEADLAREPVDQTHVLEEHAGTPGEAVFSQAAPGASATGRALVTARMRRRRRAQENPGYWVSPDNEWHVLEDEHGMGRMRHGDWAARWFFEQGDVSAGRIVDRNGDAVVIDPDGEPHSIYSEEAEEAEKAGTPFRPASCSDVDIGDDYFIEDNSTYHTEGNWEEKLMCLGWVRVIIGVGVSAAREGMPFCFEVAKQLLEEGATEALSFGLMEDDPERDYMLVDILQGPPGSAYATLEVDRDGNVGSHFGERWASVHTTSAYSGRGRGLRGESR